MGFKSTMDLTREEAIHIIAHKLHVPFESNIDRQLERLLEHVTDYNNEESEYYFKNFSVAANPEVL